MPADPKGRTMVVSYEGGTVSAAQGLLEWLFGLEQPQWGAGSVGETATGRKRYRYGSRQRSAAAAGEQVLLDCGEEGVYSVRVTGNIVDFIAAMLPRTDDRVKRAYTRRGSVYGPTFENL